AADEILHPYFDRVDDAAWLFGEVVPGNPPGMTFYAKPPDDVIGAKSRGMAGFCIHCGAITVGDSHHTGCQSLSSVVCAEQHFETGSVLTFPAAAFALASLHDYACRPC
ncbi:MAG TPA: hypothetical protein VIK97_15345, partial [Casimicrobiaceae bacterium]